MGKIHRSLDYMFYFLVYTISALKVSQCLVLRLEEKPQKPIRLRLFAILAQIISGFEASDVLQTPRLSPPDSFTESGYGPYKGMFVGTETRCGQDNSAC